MARKAGNKQANGGFSEGRFINVSLDKSNQDELEALIASDKLQLDDLLSLVSEGFKLSVKRDDTNNSFAAFLTSPASAGRPFTLTLSGRGASPIDAVYSLAYKHFVKTDGLWDTFEVSDDRSGRFG